MTQSTRLRQVTTLTYYQRVEVKVDGPGGKWTVQLVESGRSKAPKVDGPGAKWTVRKDIKWTVHESGRSKTRKWTVHKE